MYIHIGVPSNPRDPMVPAKYIKGTFDSKVPKNVPLVPFHFRYWIESKFDKVPIEMNEDHGMSPNIFVAKKSTSRGGRDVAGFGISLTHLRYFWGESDELRPSTPATRVRKFHGCHDGLTAWQEIDLREFRFSGHSGAPEKFLSKQDGADRERS